ncbi:phage tail sheath subtilisin-like domain-containing protein [uncultured Sphingomonas sp.]|uniref:phage tail sheath subtilisin-like domain-containing protein n=1 Tax=uncultured Sphingomonas sp. TaxID=158754 RepID=UPI0025ED7E2A|nr:phage tail sheath subtilisin-like domain-containing protein [uncultured Sphingomonas sp.]
MSFRHGIAVIETGDTSRALRTIATAVIGLVATAPDAKADAFPIDTPVLVTDIGTAIIDAGAGGTLQSALEAIGEQVRAPVIVVRVAPGADVTATNLAVIGEDTLEGRTGLQALLAADAVVGVKPRIIGAPGLDTQPVAAQLALVAKKLRGMAYARAIGADTAALAAYRANFNQRELMLIYPDVTVADGVLGASKPSPAVAHALGLRALIDQVQGFHKTLSNVALQGVTGLTVPVQFDIQDEDTDANILNAADITTLVRINGELRFWGNHTCGADENFLFESATRTAQVLADTIAEGMTWAIDKPLTPSLARDIVERINEKLRLMKRAGQLLGGECWFDPAGNPADQLKIGRLKISYRYTPVPPLEQLGLEQQITDEYLADFATQVANA